MAVEQSLIRRIFPAIMVFVLIPGAVIALLYWIFSYVTEEPLVEDRLVLKEASFSDLKGWQADDFDGFMEAFGKSCEKFSRLPQDRSLGGQGIAGTVADWSPICQEMELLPKEADVLRNFIERKFTPVLVKNEEDPKGMFTGYYEASLRGSLTQSEKYATPLYLRPDELVMVHLGRFRDSLKGQRIAGVVKNGELYPFADRKEIEEGALEGRDLEIVWVDSAVDAFFLHIQGSGRIALDDGGALRVGYAGQNGHPYYAIGKTLIKNGDVSVEDMSMQAIRSWLEQNPDKATELMQENASYIFFRELNTNGPIGAQGVELTALRSLAIDRKWMPLGVPLWLSTTIPTEDGSDPEEFNRLMVAQDTGGAIRGPVRGDVFWGYGKKAYEGAGAMKNEGQYWMLLPKPVAARHFSENNPSS
ncbi:murein transglycosylase [Sneathiella sp. P13V-1]|uniref:murein transglycosylase A n=1 Tax=Sneathiella sp. P13V-1 TaxID=2697366 RepID=UPI00187B2C9F|nr:MltA domain-containing protein [Sneathiella sp. P13V-1]MBE7636064.1 murein transglycosylase [Sneathiella sp. P13V-1]